jgi:imidazolonepropionase-like amidohydrolase
MKWGGLSEEQALSLITLNPAKQLRIDDRVGSIEVGKDADIAIFDKHPLSVYAVAQKTLVDGQVYFDRARDLERRAEIETRRKALLEKRKGENR